MDLAVHTSEKTSLSLGSSFLNMNTATASLSVLLRE